MSELKRIEVVTGLIFKNGRLLACRRRAEGLFPLKWEFPGGKIETGEDPGTAFERELREELNIVPRGARQVFTHVHNYPGFYTVKLTFFSVAAYSGQIRNLAFAEMRWARAHQLAQLDFLEGDIPVVTWLTRGGGAALYDLA